MRHHLLATIIEHQFEQNPGMNQSPLWGKKPKEPKALLITFKTTLDYKVEEGYRFLDLLIYAPTNYVQVWTRERSNIYRFDDPEKRYVETNENWIMHTDHDSVWRSAISNVIGKYEDKLLVFDGAAFGSWYKIIPVPPELEELRKKQRKNRGY